MTSISDLDFPLISHLVSFLSCSPSYSVYIKEALIHTFFFLRTRKVYYHHFLPNLTALIRKYRLTTEYKGCERDYTGLAMANFDPPYLVDALSSRPITIYSTYDTFTEKIEQDVMDMIDLIPDALTTKGKLPYQFRYRISPLSVACFNYHVPLGLIEYMLQKGADPNEMFVHTAVNLSISSVYDLTLSLGMKNAGVNDFVHQRNISLLILLEKYGGKGLCEETEYKSELGNKPLMLLEDEFPDLITPTP